MMDAEKLELPPPVSDLKRFAGADCVPPISEGADIDTPIADSDPYPVPSVRHNINADYSDCMVGSQSTVSILSILRSPPTVLGGVITIVINTIQRVLTRGTGTHRREKACKQRPLRAYIYPSPPIVTVLVAVGVSAPLFHTYPRIILWAVSHPMRRMCLYTLSCYEATTTQSSAITEPRTCHCCISPAVTEAMPASTVLRVITRISYNSKLVKLLAKNVFESWVLRKWYTFLNVHNDLVNQKWMGSTGYSRYSHTLT